MWAVLAEWSSFLGEWSCEEHVWVILGIRQHSIFNLLIEFTEPIVDLLFRRESRKVPVLDLRVLRQFVLEGEVFLGQRSVFPQNFIHNLISFLNILKGIEVVILFLFCLCAGIQCKRISNPVFVFLGLDTFQKLLQLNIGQIFQV